MRHASPFKTLRVSLLLMLTCVGFAMLPDSTTQYLSLDRGAIAGGEIWRLWTAHLTHFSWRHMWVDSWALFVMSVLIERELGCGTFARWLLIAAPSLSLTLLLAAPDLAEYRGASGLCMMLAVVLGASIWHRNCVTRGLVSMLVICGIAKTLLEMFWQAPNISALPSDIAIVWQAHVLGAGCGVVWIFNSPDTPRAFIGGRGTFLESTVP